MSEPSNTDPTTFEEARMLALGKAIAPIVRSAIGGLSHTNIGYSSEHDALADPCIDDILKLVSQAIAEAVEAELDRITRLFPPPPGDIKNRKDPVLFYQDYARRRINELQAKDGNHVD